MSYLLTLADVPAPAEAARLRPALERAVLDAKRIRRLALGPNMTLLFENRLTCLWQVREMVRVEKITDSDAIQHEIDTYNALLPGPAELSATLLIEYPDPVERAVMVARLVGLHEHLHLHLGGGGRRVPVRFDGEQLSEARISSVQFLRVPLLPDELGALRDLSSPVVLESTHPAYQNSVVLPLVLRAAILEDMGEAGGAA